MNDFIYSYPTKVYFGNEATKKAFSSELKNMGNTVMLAYGCKSAKQNGVYNEIYDYLKDAGKEIVDFGGIMPNPTYKKVQEGAKLAREKQVDFILAVGGGSVIDCCKIISAQALCDKDIWEMEFKDHVFPSDFIPMGAIVTASGTGAEMNNGAVITNEDVNEKAGVWGAHVNFAILNPEYTMSLPEKQVISGAFDTLSHCMETYLGTPRIPNLSDQINESIMRVVIENMKKLLIDAYDMDARSELMWASAMAENGILKIGKVTDFQAHQIEHQLGAYTDCNHGQGLAVIHPVLYRHMYKEGLNQFVRLAKEVWHVDSVDKTAEDIALAGIEALASFIKDMELPTTLTEMKITDENILRNVADTCNLTAGCVKKFERDEIFEILKECL